MRFGDYIAKRRKELGLSQKELAQRVLKEDGDPISPQYLNDIERNRRNPPSGDLLHRLAEQIGMSPEYLGFLAGELEIPEDLQNQNPSQERVEAAFRAFRKAIERPE